MGKLKEFTIICPVVSAVGHQAFSIMAKNKEDAIQRFKNGVDCEFLHEEIEVQHLGEPEIIEE